MDLKNYAKLKIPTQTQIETVKLRQLSAHELIRCQTAMSMCPGCLAD